MYGASGKLGRGRGGGPPKRNIHSTFQPSSVQRPSAAPGGGRLSAGGGHRNRNNTPAAPAAVSTVDETFSLVRNNPLNFGMIIKLSPVLVEEIKRLEAQGHAARIKFDSSANNPVGNVIDVGGKEFRFTWAQETGDLCDIYEERRSGDNGDGLLVESGGAWRKLNVQRELDESLSNHVKMRTVEADRKHKSRKAIILDHGNPSMKKALAAAEVNNSWRGSFNKKKEPPFKKMKGEPSSVIPPKSGGKPGLSSSTPSKIRASASPILSTPEQSGVPLSPLINRNITKVPLNREDATLTQSSKPNASTSEKEIVNRVPTGILHNKQGSNERFGNKPSDLQSLLISLLMEKPQGLNFKALEKAVGETIPKSVKQIEPILKKIAVFQPTGRYILKPDFELESSRKSLSESGSSPENNNHHRETMGPELTLKPDNMKEFEDPSHLIPESYEDLNTSDKIDIEHRSPDVLLHEKKVSDNSEGPAATSSLSGSDSDSESDSSDSGSDSGTPKSRVGSGSDSSDSESDDASSNSKQGSDEDVDIMSDDDKEPKQQFTPLPPPVPLHNDHVSDLLFGKDLFEDNHEHDNDNDNDKDGDNYENATRNTFIDHQESELLKNKRGSDEKHFDENENSKRLKTGNWGRTVISRGGHSFSESPPSEGPYKGTAATTNQMNRTVRDVSDYDFDKLGNREFPGNSTSDSPRSIDLNMGVKGFGTDRHGEGLDGHFKDKKPPKNSRLGGDGIKHSGSREKKQHGGSIGKNKDSGLVIKDSLMDLKKSPVVNGCGPGPTLRRELSDLEMGELRENLQEEPSGGNKKRVERNNSFKQAEKSSDYWNLDSSKGKISGIGRTSLESVKPVVDDHLDDFTKVNGKPMHVKPGSQHNNNSKGREVVAGAILGIGSEGYTDSQRKAPPHKHEKQVGPVANKKQKSNNDLGEKRKDLWDSGQKRREMESCSDDSITSYTKYEKEEPEMKGPIRDLSQYNEYVQEYREKYDCYQTLNKILESYRNEFQNFGRDLEVAKERDNDRYNKILDQLMESYRQCGTKHKRLKKIFVVLHHELQHLKEMIREFAEKQTKGG
ncbi:uncharacterized protein LOC111906863 isoform X2 [Lactuca sativa]|uniref:uncharacterized protein LOC111906863 isoform X2 n=1 Tax=Lactuca sativa TaxID=4236 RepID=UPI000CD936E5|nr:uncharacterized protein LOC111906863 isoform X2 [Lactuca sativa]